VVTNASSNPPSAASSQPAVATEASADVNVPVQPVGEGSVDPGSEPEEAVPSPIVAMRAIRIEETKMRSPSAPTIEAGEATYEEVAEDLDEEARAHLAPSPLPTNLDPSEEP